MSRDNKVALFAFAVLAALMIMCLLIPAEADAKAKWSKWSGSKVEASCFGCWEGETITATGKRITRSSSFVAVPVRQVVSKKKWKKLSAKNKRRYFYYGEKIQFKRTYKGKVYKAVGVVEDCGGFYGYGRRVNGKWVPRQFDLTDGVFNRLHFKGLTLVNWRYAL